MDKKNLDKIVGYLLDDIEIHYNYQSLQIIGSDIEYDIEFLSDKFFGKVWDILEYDYGLNSGDCVYVYGNLLYQINKKMKDYGSINESSITRKSYLDKILDYIVDDTMINSRDWEPPFHPSSYSFYILDPASNQYLYPYFYKYCNDNYGLTNDEVRSLWEPYLDRVDKLSRKKPY